MKMEVHIVSNSEGNGIDSCGNMDVPSPQKLAASGAVPLAILRRLVNRELGDHCFKTTIFVKIAK